MSLQGSFLKKNILVEHVSRFVRAIIFLRHRLSDKQFLIACSIMVGLLAGGVAVLLKSTVHLIQDKINAYTHSYEDFLLFAFFPLLGIALTVLLIQTLWRDSFKKGSAEITYAITKKMSQLPMHQAYAHVATSALTVGFGGSTGLESPLVSTGSALGSNVGRLFRLSYKEKTILLACGASAGIAAAFNSPIAGVLFAIEVLLADMSAAAFIPLIIAAATGALLSKVVLAEGILLSFPLVSSFDYRNTHFYLLLGLATGLFSLYYARSFEFVHDRMKSIRRVWLRVAIGGLLLAFLILLFPSLFGEGYSSIKSLSTLDVQSIVDRSVLKPWLSSEAVILAVLGVILFMKPLAAAITIGSGGNGGSFGPSLFTGAYLGFVFSRSLNLAFGAHIPEMNFTLVAMAGMLSGIFYAPLTAIFLIAEITGGYGLIIPLMIVAAISLAVVHYFQPKSMEAKKLSRLLNASIDDRDQYLLSRLNLQSLIETNFLTVSPSITLRELRQVVAASRRNSFAVINEHDELVGIIHLDDIRQVIFSEGNDHVQATDLMSIPTEVIASTDTLQVALRKFDSTGLWNLPVVEGKKYVGFISKSTLLARYRNELIRSV